MGKDVWRLGSWTTSMGKDVCRLGSWTTTMGKDVCRLGSDRKSIRLNPSDSDLSYTPPSLNKNNVNEYSTEPYHIFTSYALYLFQTGPTHFFTPVM